VPGTERPLLDLLLLDVEQETREARRTVVVRRPRLFKVTRPTLPPIRGLLDLLPSRMRTPGAILNDLLTRSPMQPPKVLVQQISPAAVDFGRIRWA
jgi:hypothetical protein